MILISPDRDLILWGATISPTSIQAEIAYIDAHIGDRINLSTYRSQEHIAVVRIPRSLQTLDCASRCFDLELAIESS